MRILRESISFLHRINIINFIILMLILSYLVVTPLYPFIGLENTTRDNSFDSLIIAMLFICLLVPLIETFFFQYLVIRLCLKIFKNNNSKFIIVVLISALLFSVSHPYNTFYVVYMFLVGIILAFSYLYCFYYKAWPFVVVTTIHSLRNLIAVLLIYYT